MSVTEENETRPAEAGRAAPPGRRKGKLESGGPAPTYEGDFVLESHLALECGRTLVRPMLHYAVYGRLNAARDNAVLVCHALSGSALVGAWWPGLMQQVRKSAPLHGVSELAGEDAGRNAGPSTPPRSAQDDRISGGIVNLETDCVICVNLLGSCYGSTGPGSVNSEKVNAERPDEVSLYGPEFPLVSIRDNVRAQAELIQALGIRRLKLAIGGSIGGMQALEWAILFPERVERAVVIGVAPLNAMGLALNHLQRRAIQNDPEWREGWYLPHQQPRRGLALARQIAMLSYKSPELFEERFGRNPNRNGEDPWGLDRDGGGLGADAGRFDVAGFLDYQGERFPERFDANAYLAILRTMDTWDPGRGWRSEAEALGRIQARVTFVGISSDALFPAVEVRALAEAARQAGANAEYREMATLHGHDAFLAEQGELVRVVGSG
ncbi:MAG TPA: homoserine O-acetyltransferase [Acidobacteriaceae bacterium]|nr:homoserine O-acetyltransferase [Acidobacteriaceae bacterium]